MNISIRTRSGEWTAELYSSDITNEIWLSLPFSATINIFGSQIYFEMPLDNRVKGDSKEFEKGDIAYWPDAGALCIFFGPSMGIDVLMKKIGRVICDCDDMELSGDRTRITLNRSF